LKDLFEFEYYNKSDQVNRTVKKAWRALHFIMLILKKGNSSIKSFAYVSLVRPILEFGPRAGIRTGRDKKNTLGRVEKSCQICKSYEHFELGILGVA